MSLLGEIVLGVLMAVGLVGVLVPILPGLLMIGAVALVWGFLTATTAGWLVVAAMLVVMAVGTAAKYLLPGGELRAQRVPRRTWLLAAALGVVGFFVVPVIGLGLGFVLGTYLGELLRFGDHAPAWRSSRRLLTSIGKGIAIEFAAGLVAIVIWVVAVLG